MADEIFDFVEITRRALGPHWTTGTPAQREELVQLFAELLERSYVGRIESYSGERVAWLGDSTDNDLATVRTRIVTKAGTEIPVEYRMHRRGERWVAYDVTIEGISLVGNYRAQFNKIIQNVVPRRARGEASGQAAVSAVVKPGAPAHAVRVRRRG